MKLLTRHAFSVSPEAYWASFWDPAWEEAEQAHQDVTREVLSETEVDGVVTLHQRYHTPHKLPAAVMKSLDADTLSYEQVSIIDKNAGTITWRVIPPAMADKIKAEGTMRVVATPTGCERIVEGEVNVKVPLIGKKIERGVVDAITSSHEAEAERRRAWLAKNA